MNRRNFLKASCAVAVLLPLGLPLVEAGQGQALIDEWLMRQIQIAAMHVIYPPVVVSTDENGGFTIDIEASHRLQEVKAGTLSHLLEMRDALNNAKIPDTVDVYEVT